jgi:signal peptidase I
MAIFKKVVSALSTIFLILVIFLAYGSLENRWYRVVTVQGNSMAPTLWIGDLMIVTPPPPEIPVNTIVVMSMDGELVTHRVVGYDETGRAITKGDANDSIDMFTNPNLRIVGVYQLHLPGLGYPLLFLSQMLNRA